MSEESVQELRDMFEYHTDGYLIRKKNGKPCGMHANNGKGYAQVWCGGKLLYAHRIVYAIVHGKMPEGQIDHLNGDRSDNRIENLRDVSKSVNMHNCKKPKDNSSGFTGVSWHARYQKWLAYITIDNRNIHLGYFTEFEDAVYARKMAKIKYHPTSPEAQKFALHK